MKKKSKHGGITSQWLVELGGRADGGVIRFTSRKDQFGRYNLRVKANHVGGCLVETDHVHGETFTPLKPYGCANRQKLLDLLTALNVPHKGQKWCPR